MRKHLVLAVAVLAALALVVVGLQWWQGARMSDFDRALSVAPADAQRLTFTDWAEVRRSLGTDLAPDSSADDVEQFMSDAFEEDLTSMSALPESTPVMHADYGFSPATLDWELLSQSEEGAVVVMKLAEDTDMDAVESTLEDLGYQRPDAETGVWVGGVDLLPTIGTLTPELQFLAVDADERIVVGSDASPYLAQAMTSVLGDADSADGVDEVAGALGEPVAAAVYDGPVACSALAMGNADPSEQDQADDLIAAAGEVNPVTGFAMAREPGGDLRVAMSFESEDQARVNADSRAALASGPAPGQGGAFTDRFTLGPVRADGVVLTMELEPVEGEYVLSDLTSGPVLFATC